MKTLLPFRGEYPICSAMSISRVDGGDTFSSFSTCLSTGSCLSAPSELFLDLLICQQQDPIIEDNKRGCSLVIGSGQAKWIQHREKEVRLTEDQLPHHCINTDLEHFGRDRYCTVFGGHTKGKVRLSGPKEEEMAG